MKRSRWWDREPLELAQISVARRDVVDPGFFKVQLFVSGEPVTLAWPGDTVEEVASSFGDYLTNDDEHDDEALPTSWRSLEIVQAGERLLLVFRADWIAGFVVTRK